MKIQTVRLLGAAMAAIAFGAAAADKTATPEAKPVSISQLFDDPVVVRGKGVEVKRSQLEDAFTAYAANLAARGETLQSDERSYREAQLLDRLIITRLLVNRASDKDKERAKELSEKFIKEARRATSSEEMFRRQLKAAGMTMEAFNNRVMEQALAEAVIERELRPKVTVTDAEVDEFYKTGIDFVVKDMEKAIERMGQNPNTTIGDLADARRRVDEMKRLNLAKLEQPEKVRVSHILITTRDADTEQEFPPDKKKQKRTLADQVLTRARAGEDFAKLMKQYSDDKSAAGGDYVLSREDPFVPEFKSAAFTLKPNTISDIVTSMFGYHIIKLHERIPAKKIDFAKVSPEIKEALIQQAVQSKMPEYFAGVKKEAAIEVLDPRYKLQLPKVNTDSLRKAS
jgi:parvulin-like peptidyl-prolyl isomerase